VTRRDGGKVEIRSLLNDGDLDRVAPSVELANRLLSEAQANLASAQTVHAIDPGGALQLAYDSARKAATSLLAAQGLRATTAGGHVAVQRAVRAQFGSPFDRFGRMRRRRHQQEYPTLDSPTATKNDAAEMIDFARDAIEAAQAILASGKLRPWT
jgi:hypothetical protein